MNYKSVVFGKRNEKCCCHRINDKDITEGKFDCFERIRESVINFI